MLQVIAARQRKAQGLDSQEGTTNWRWKNGDRAKANTMMLEERSCSESEKRLGWRGVGGKGQDAVNKAGKGVDIGGNQGLGLSHIDFPEDPTSDADLEEGS